MFFIRAERASDAKLKIVMMMRAINVIDEAEENVAEENLYLLYDLKGKIQTALNAIGDLPRVVKEMHDNPVYKEEAAFVEARISLLNETAPQESFMRAYGIAKAESIKKPDDAPLLRTYSRLHNMLYPNDLKGLYSILQMRYGISKEKRNLTLLYELGKLAFIFKEYDDSISYFKNLERLSQGHPKRWHIQDYGMDEHEKHVEFQGTIVRRESSNMGYVEISQLRRRVPFLPYAQKYTPEVGDNVTFEIGFNYRGWLAVDLTK